MHSSPVCSHPLRKPPLPLFHVLLPISYISYIHNYLMETKNIIPVNAIIPIIGTLPFSSPSVYPSACWVCCRRSPPPSVTASAMRARPAPSGAGSSPPSLSRPQPSAWPSCAPACPPPAASTTLLPPSLPRAGVRWRAGSSGGEFFVCLFSFWGLDLGYQ